jgi:hypothetical protein
VVVNLEFKEELMGDFYEDTFEEIRVLLFGREIWEKSLKAFHEAFDKKFPKDSPEERGAALGLMWSLFTEVIVMSSMGFSRGGIIEAQAILEEYSRRELLHHVASSSGREIVDDVLSKQSLMALARYLETLGALSKKDVEFSGKLSEFRNSLAHRNVKSMKRLMKLPVDVHPLNVWVAAARADWIPYQLGCIMYMMHLSRCSARKG